MVGSSRWNWLIVLFLAFAVGCASDDPSDLENQAPQNQNDGEKDEAELEVSADDPMSWTLEVGATDTGSFDIANTGEELLEFDVDAEADWIGFAPASGEVEGDESTSVEVDVSCPDEVGEYSATVTVDSNGGSYDFEAELNCEAPAPGQLEVNIEGLPSGVDADVTVEGPDDFQEQLSQTTSFDEAPVGEYEVTANEVGDDAVYVPTPDQLTVEVESEAEASVTIEYDAIPGDVLVSVDGLPGHLEPSLTLVRGSDEWSVPENGLVQDLEPGSYTVVADPVEDGEDTWEASDTAVTVKSDEIADVTVTFMVDVGYLEIGVSGLPDDTDHNIDVVASDGTVTEVPQTGSVTLEAGTYDVEAHDVEVGLATYEASGDTSVVIEEGETKDVSISYDLIEAEVEVIIDGLDGVSGTMEIDFIGDEETKTVTDAGMITLFPDTYSVEPGDVTDGLATYSADSTTVPLASGSNDDVTIEYAVETAQLDIELSGDLDEGDATIEVTSTDGYDETFDGSVFLDELFPSEYTVTVHDVDDGPATYEGSGSDTLALASGDAESLTASYELITVDVIVNIDEYGDVDYEFELSGPDGFEESLTSSASFSGEAPGDYQLELVNAEDDGFGNDPYIDIDPDTAVTVTSNQGGQEFSVEARAANVVTTESDDASTRGSLRFVVDDVVTGTEIVFADNISEIGLSEGQITIDKEIGIFGDTSDRVVVDAMDASRIFYVDDSGVLTLEGLELTGGYAEGSSGYDDRGGALRITGTGEAYVRGVLFKDNEAEHSGGAVHVSGDGLFVAEETVFEDNIAELWGAAVQTSGGLGDLNLVYLQRSLFLNNEAKGDGGVIDGFASSGLINIEQSTFAGNSSRGLAAAIVILSGDAIIEGTTVSGNSNSNVENDEVGGIFAGGNSVTLRGTIVADNNEQDLGGYASSLHSEGFNIIGDASAVTNDVDWEDSDHIDVSNPGLQPLADNGGPTSTMRLASHSPARSIIPLDDCLAGELDWSIDQRGHHRPAGAFCSAGAYEIEASRETFENADMSAQSYEDGSFVGDDGVEWTYVETRRSGSLSGSIDGTSVILYGSPDSSVRTEQLSGGISSLSMQLAHAFSADGDRQVEVFVNGESVGTSQAFDDGDVDGISGDGSVHHFAVEDIDVSGDFDIEIVSVGDGQVLVDNVSWE